MLGSEQRSQRMVRVTLAGPALAGFPTPQPAASVRLLLPSEGELVMPTWNGNEFLLPDGERPVIRTFTPHHRPAVTELDLDIVLHDGGTASAWALEAPVGDPVAVSGPGTGYEFDPKASLLVIVGDESAIAAAGQLLEAAPRTLVLKVTIEAAGPGARVALPHHPRAEIQWLDLPPGEAPGSTLMAALEEADLGEGTRVWAAGEAAAMHRIRQQLFTERGLPRWSATVRGYWKQRT